MKKQLDKVKKFQDAFGCHMSDKISTLNPELCSLRYNLAEEELKEYETACTEEDIVGIADALGDQLYILLGTILAHGMENIIEEVFDKIHESNMSKLDENGKPIYREDGKILKGSNYFKPNIKSVLDIIN